MIHIPYRHYDTDLYHKSLGSFITNGLANNISTRSVSLDHAISTR